MATENYKRGSGGKTHPHPSQRKETKKPPKKQYNLDRAYSTQRETLWRTLKGNIKSEYKNPQHTGFALNWGNLKTYGCEERSTHLQAKAQRSCMFWYECTQKNLNCTSKLTCAPPTKCFLSNLISDKSKAQNITPPQKKQVKKKSKNFTFFLQICNLTSLNHLTSLTHIFKRVKTP